MTVKELREALAEQPDWLVVTDRQGHEIEKVRPWVGDLRLEPYDVHF